MKSLASRSSPPSSKPPLTCDEAKRGKRNPVKISRAERDYWRSLTGVGRHIGELVDAFTPGDVSGLPTLMQLLERYSIALKPWATQIASRMLGEVNARDLDSWRKLGSAISEQLRRDIISTPVGEQMRQLLDSQVSLIQSIPLDAAQRVHELTLKGLEDSTRFSQYVDEIQRTGAVSKSRAQNIAQTETSRTASVLTEVRAKSAGSETYVWRTAGDADVREDHKILANKVFRWDDPPIADRRTGARAHPGCIYRCRCYPEPQIVDTY